MILVLAGTGEGRRTAFLLASSGFRVLATATSSYGAELLRESGVQEVVQGPLDRTCLSGVLDGKIQVVVDATHPYAVNITRTTLELCRQKNIPYLRLERPAAEIPAHPLVSKAPGLEEALELALTAVEEGATLFSSLGSKNLPAVVQAASQKRVRVIARVLPEPEVLARCRELGLKPGQVIAAQGPFSRRLNRELFSAYSAGAVITKESGEYGGVDTKVAAALELGIPVAVWARPFFEYPRMVRAPEEALAEVKALVNN